MNERRIHIPLVAGGLALAALLLLGLSAVASNHAGLIAIDPQAAERPSGGEASLEVLPTSGRMRRIFSITGNGFQPTELISLTIAQTVWWF